MNFNDVVWYISFQESPEISDRLGSDSDDVIPVKANITIPNLKRAEELDRKAQFSLLIPYHRELAKFLITVFMGKIEHPGEGPSISEKDLWK